MSDILDELANSAHKRVKAGYYQHGNGIAPDPAHFSRLTGGSCHNPVIGEIKFGSPTRGRILGKDIDPVELGKLYSRGCVGGFSVLTDPDHFYGTLDNLVRIATLGKPVLMKDFFVDHSQIDAAKRLGADAVLFIYRLFSRRISGFSLEDGIKYAQDLDLEVLLETNDLSEYESALETKADMIGINNRDLRSLEVDLSTTENILSRAGKNRAVWSMSGISGQSDIEFLKEAGADFFLVGTALAEAEKPEKFLKQLNGVFDG